MKVDRIIQHDACPKDFISDDKNFLANVFATLPAAGQSMFE